MGFGASEPFLGLIVAADFILGSSLVSTFGQDLIF